MRHDRPRWTWKSMMMTVTFVMVPVLNDTLSAGGKSGDADVRLSAVAGKPDAAGKQQVTVTLAIRKGWHIYANPAKNEIVNNAKTEIVIRAGEALADIKVFYPAGKSYEDKILNATYMVYEDKVNIPATIQRAANDATPLQISVRYMACGDKTCRKGAVSVTVP